MTVSVFLVFKLSNLLYFSWSPTSLAWLKVRGRTFNHQKTNHLKNKNSSNNDSPFKLTKTRSKVLKTIQFAVCCFSFKKTSKNWKVLTFKTLPFQPWTDTVEQLLRRRRRRRQQQPGYNANFHGANIQTLPKQIKHAEPTRERKRVGEREVTGSLKTTNQSRIYAKLIPIFILHMIYTDMYVCFYFWGTRLCICAAFNYHGVQARTHTHVARVLFCRRYRFSARLANSWWCIQIDTGGLITASTRYLSTHPTYSPVRRTRSTHHKHHPATLRHLPIRVLLRAHDRRHGIAVRQQMWTRRTMKDCQLSARLCDWLCSSFPRKRT